ncbi:WD40 repeat-like protein [Backusella circina FSU 941]|nr:WD40 repeat-like protein [Backusella circina FSU 941]
MSVQNLPSISIQNDWDAVVQEVSTNTTKQGDFWISCHLTQKESLQGSVSVEQGPKLTAKEEGITIEYINSRSFKATCSDFGIQQVAVYSPKTEFEVAKTAVECIDVSPNGHLLVAGYGSEACIMSVAEGQTQQKLTGHVGDITAVQFFPSNLVVLTAAADFQLKIWSVLNGANPVTLKGHTSAITSIAIVGTNRVIIASSRDGTIKLWNCGTSSTIATLGNYTTSINKMIMVPLPSKYEAAEPESLDPVEVETADKMVLVALNDGTVHGIHLGTKKELFKTQAASASLTSISYEPETGLLATGDKQGQVALFSLFKDTSEPFLRWKRNSHAVTSLLFRHNKDNGPILCVSNADGSIYETNALTDNSICIEAEYTGNELEAVYSLITVPGQYERIACGTRDGKSCLTAFVGIPPVVTTPTLDKP